MEASLARGACVSAAGAPIAASCRTLASHRQLLPLQTAIAAGAAPLPTISAPRSLAIQRRWQSSDQFHRYLHNPHIVQPDGLDSLPRTKAEQQAWLNTEQWDGYSETFLNRHMQYAASVEHPNPAITPKNNILYTCLGLVYELYGTLAEELQGLHDDPLHPRFHDKLNHIRKDREKIAEQLDACYAALHPTVKTVYDAYLVRRYYHLGDWITHVERKRERLFESLSPEFIRQAEQARELSARYIERLHAMERQLSANPTLGLLQSHELEQYTEGELAILKQKATYFHKMRRFGANQTDADVHTH